MKKFFNAVILFVGFTLNTAAQAQQAAFVQIEARPGLQAAQARARAWSGVFTDVNGFRTTTGWYAIALGPYSDAGAVTRMQALKSENLIPQDAFVASSVDFRQQFWPVGSSVLDATTGNSDATTPVSEPDAAVTPRNEVPVPVADETPREARRSEAELNRDARKLLQVALKWEGFYAAAIDGAFGRGTRAAMTAWQQANGFAPTGVLTTQQRAGLIESYNAVLAGIGLAEHVNAAAGIRLELPLALIRETRAEAPFIHFEPQTDDGVRVLLISQTGTRATLSGLYDIMQTLEIVPPEGPRSKERDSFTLTGQNDNIVSTTWAAYENGTVKGFTLIWPTGDERRRTRVLQSMRDSFTAVAGTVLADLAGDPGEDQRIDLLAGLELRQPTLSRSGFFVDGQGTLVTTSDVVGQCRELTLDHTQPAEVVFADEALGIAVLRPTGTLAPRAHVTFRDGAARIRSDITVAGYPFEGVLEQPTLTFGRLEDIRGLSGENTLQRLSLLAEPGDSGGPVFDQGGNVIGVLLPAASPVGQKLPDIVRFSARSAAVRSALAANGIEVSAAGPGPQLAAEDLTAFAADVTVLVSCWN